MGLKSRVQKIMMGRHPLGQPRTRRKTIDLPVSATISVRDSGAIFTTTGAASAATIVATLPALVDSIGCMFTFLVTTDLNLFTVLSPEGNNIVAYSDLAATSFSYGDLTDVNNVGGGCTIINVGANWVLMVNLANDAQATTIV